MKKTIIEQLKNREINIIYFSLMDSYNINKDEVSSLLLSNPNFIYKLMLLYEIHKIIHCDKLTQSIKKKD